MSRRRVVVTGASGGIGGAVALALAARGADVDLLGRDSERLALTAAEVVSAGGGASVHAFDLGDDAALQGFAATCADASIDALVHCAGTVELGPVSSLPVERFDRQYRLNLRAPFLLTQLLLPALVRARGLIVFVNSGSGLIAKPHWGSYAASKFGLRALADSLRGEVSGAGVRVSSIYPGRVASEMQRKVREQEGEPYRPEAYLSVESVAAQITQLLDLDPGAVVSDVMIRPG